MINYKCDLCGTESGFMRKQPDQWKNLTYKVYSSYQPDIQIMVCDKCLERLGVNTDVRESKARDILENALIEVLNEAMEQV